LPSDVPGRYCRRREHDVAPDRVGARIDGLADGSSLLAEMNAYASNVAAERDDMSARVAGIEPLRGRAQPVSRLNGVCCLPGSLIARARAQSRRLAARTGAAARARSAHSGATALRGCAPCVLRLCQWRASAACATFAGRAAAAPQPINGRSDRTPGVMRDSRSSFLA
jgi:hypothetical protein